MTMIHYGYYVLLHDGRLIRAGDDWGPTADSYKPGDSMGIKNGVEGIVVGVVKGDGAKQYGSVDVMVIVDPCIGCQLLARYRCAASRRRLAGILNPLDDGRVVAQ